MTVGALVAIAEAGLEVPRDVSVVGIDDMEWYPIAQPAISAVYEPAEEMGRRAANDCCCACVAAPATSRAHRVRIRLRATAAHG